MTAQLSAEKVSIVNSFEDIFQYLYLPFFGVFKFMDLEVFTVVKIQVKSWSQR